MAETTLHNPDFLKLDDAYRGLQRLQDINIQTNQLQLTLQEMEQIGFVAIEIIDVNEDRESYTITASKGKHGLCKFEGTTATYSGIALAALDDDLHLLPEGRKVAVCEKTRDILDLSPYKKLVIIDEPTKDEDRIENIDQVGNNELDVDSAIELVYKGIEHLSPDTSGRQMLFYPGPFRMLILHDGTMVRRGKWNNVPTGILRHIHDKDRFISRSDVEVVSAEYLQELYPERGSSILLGERTKLKQATTEYPKNFDSLARVKEPLRSRLLQMISENRKYFLLVGNEASDTYGCCPSEEVTEANKLVKSGILDAFSEPATGDACPVTLYAFRNEMILSENGLEGEPDATFRTKVMDYLKRKDYSSVHLVIKWILIAFVAVSLLLGMRNCYNQQVGNAAKQVTMERINPEGNFQAVLVLFHNQKRCYQCLEMEKLSHDVFDKMYGASDTQRSVGFKTLVIDDPASAQLVDQFGIFAATLVLIDYSDPGKPVGEVLKKAPELYRDPEAFTEYLMAELEMYID